MINYVQLLNININVEFFLGSFDKHFGILTLRGILVCSLSRGTSNTSLLRRCCIMDGLSLLHMVKTIYISWLFPTTNKSRENYNLHHQKQMLIILATPVQGQNLSMVSTVNDLYCEALMTYTQTHLPYFPVFFQSYPQTASRHSSMASLCALVRQQPLDRR